MKRNATKESFVSDNEKGKHRTKRFKSGSSEESSMPKDLPSNIVEFVPLDALLNSEDVLSVILKMVNPIFAYALRVSSKNCLEKIGKILSKFKIDVLFLKECHPCGHLIYEHRCEYNRPSCKFRFWTADEVKFESNFFDEPRCVDRLEPKFRPFQKVHKGPGIGKIVRYVSYECENVNFNRYDSEVWTIDWETLDGGEGVLLDVLDPHKIQIIFGLTLKNQINTTFTFIDMKYETEESLKRLYRKEWKIQYFYDTKKNKSSQITFAPAIENLELVWRE